MGVVERVPRYLHLCQFFCSESACQKLYSVNKIIGDLKNGPGRFFSDFRGRMGVVDRVPRYFHRCQFFYSQSVCLKLYSGNKIIGDLKNGEIRIFFVFLEQIRAVLGVVLRCFEVSQFFCSQSACQKWYSGNKIFGDLKNSEIRIFFVFLEQIRVVLGVFRGALRVSNFFIVSMRARNCIP